MNENDDPKFNQVLIALGSNLKPEKNILEAQNLLEKELVFVSCSPVYQTPAIGSNGPDYLNSAILAETIYDLQELRDLILSKIETQLGRIRSENKYLDRTIDLDVLIFNHAVIDGDLWNQAHIAVPASDILPDFANPDTGENLSQAAARLLPGSKIQIRHDLT